MSSGSSEEILKLCQAIDESAGSAYRQLAATVEDRSLGELFASLGEEPARSCEHLRRLVAAATEQKLPQLFDQSLPVMQELAALLPGMEGIVPLCRQAKDADAALALAGRLELCRLHPAFATLREALEEVVEPGAQQARVSNAERLTAVIEGLPKADPEVRLLAGTLRWTRRLGEEVARHWYHDEMTGLLSRRGFLRAAEHVLSLARRYGWHVGVLVIDLDRLREINNRHGQEAGDEVLRSVARALTTSFRVSDLVGRTGGDEFTVVLPDVRLGVVLSIADHARGKIEAAAGACGPLTASIGVGCGPVTTAGHEALEGLLRQADAGLTRAQQAGGNRVVAG
jgi:diguanylate cyclase (GGDEF)-like protein